MILHMIECVQVLAFVIFSVSQNKLLNIVGCYFIMFLNTEYMAYFFTVSHQHEGAHVIDHSHVKTCCLGPMLF